MKKSDPVKKLSTQKLSILGKIILKITGKKIPSETEEKTSESEEFLTEYIHKPNIFEKYYLSDPSFMRIRIIILAGMFLLIPFIGFNEMYGIIGLVLLHFLFLISFVIHDMIEIRNKMSWRFRCLFLKDLIKMMGITAIDFDAIKRLDFMRMKKEAKAGMNACVDIKKVADVKAALTDWDDTRNKWKQ